MTKAVEIEALKPFNKTPQGQLCEVGERFSVDEVRALELERGKLAKRTGKAGGKAVGQVNPGVVAAVTHEARALATVAVEDDSAVKAAPEPANKMARTPTNKARKLPLRGE